MIAATLASTGGAIAPLLVAGGALLVSAVVAAVGYARAKPPAANPTKIFVEAADQVVLIQRGTIAAMEVRLTALEKEVTYLRGENASLRAQLNGKRGD